MKASVTPRKHTLEGLARRILELEKQRERRDQQARGDRRGFAFFMGGR